MNIANVMNLIQNTSKAPEVSQKESATKDFSQTFTNVLGDNKQNVTSSKQEGKQPVDVTYTKNPVQQTTTEEDIVKSVVESGNVDLGSVIATITEQLQEILGMTEEELMNLLSEMGLVPTDLLQIDQLQQVCLKAFEATDLSEALTNEGLHSALMEVDQMLETVVAQLKEQLPVEEFEQLLANVQEKPVQTKEEKTMVDSEKPTTEEPQPQIQKEIEVVVTKETSKDSEQATTDHKKESTKQTFVEAFTTKLEEVASSRVEMMEEPVHQTDIVNQIVEQIKVNIGKEKTSMELLLNPESLGKVQVVVANKEGVLTAQLTVQNQVAKEAIETSLSVLKESFEEQGLKVQEVEVAIGNYSSEYSGEDNGQSANEQQGSKRKLSLEEINQLLDGTNEMVSNEMVENYNGSVSYTA